VVVIVAGNAERRVWVTRANGRCLLVDEVATVARQPTAGAEVAKAKAACIVQHKKEKIEGGGYAEMRKMQVSSCGSRNGV